MTYQKLFHQPVLKKEILAVLLVDKVKTFFDGTVGLGGHAEAILENFPSISHYIACDLDQQHLLYAQKRLEKWTEKTTFHPLNFSAIKDLLSEKDFPRPLVVLLDLGLCSHHVDNPEKGFSFQKDGPLNMAFDGEGVKTRADEILNKKSVQELVRIFRAYGQEPQALKIAQKIVEYREENPLKTTGDLRKIIESCVHPKNRNKALMRVFQAVRIEVNQELEHLQKALDGAFLSMISGDRLGVISYHALEDQIVKDAFTQKSKPKTIETEFSLHTPIASAKFKRITKKPIVPTNEEVEDNPRSRSAKLRIIEKI